MARPSPADSTVQKAVDRHTANTQRIEKAALNLEQALDECSNGVVVKPLSEDDSAVVQVKLMESERSARAMRGGRR